METRLLNGNEKVTIIQQFNHEVIVIGPEGTKKRKFSTLTEAKLFIEHFKYEVNVAHLHPANGEGNIK